MYRSAENGGRVYCETAVNAEATLEDLYLYYFSEEEKDKVNG